MKFEDVCKYGKCAVCGNETKVAVCASSCGPISVAYCKDCLSRGLEPYDLLVTEYSFLLRKEAREFAERNEKIFKEFYKKTTKEFIDDCEEKQMQFEEMCY